MITSRPMTLTCLLISKPKFQLLLRHQAELTSHMQRIQTPQIQGPPTNTSSWLLNFLSYWWEPYMPRDTVNSSLIHLPINSAIPQCSDGSNILRPCPGPNSYHLLPGTTWCSCLPRTQIRTRIPASYRLKIKKESYLFWLNIVVRLSNNSSCMSKSCVHAC